MSKEVCYLVNVYSRIDNSFRESHWFATEEEADMAAKRLEDSVESDLCYLEVESIYDEH